MKLRGTPKPWSWVGGAQSRLFGIVDCGLVAEQTKSILWELSLEFSNAKRSSSLQTTGAKDWLWQGRVCLGSHVKSPRLDVQSVALPLRLEPIATPVAPHGPSASSSSSEPAPPPTETPPLPPEQQEQPDPWTQIIYNLDQVLLVDETLRFVANFFF